MERLIEMLSISSAGIDEQITRQFSDVAASKDVTSLLNENLQQLAADADYLPSTFLDDAVVIHQGAAFMLYVRRMEPSAALPPALSTAFASALMLPLRDEDVIAFRRFALRDGVDLSVFERDEQATLVEERGVGRRDPPARIFQADLVHFQVSEPTNALLLVESNNLPYQWTFDSATLRPLFVSASLPALSRVETLIEVMSAIGDSDPESIAWRRDTLLGYLQSPLHFIRWRALQLLCKVSPNDGLAALEAATRDGHPHVAKAARAALDKIQTPTKAA